MFSITSNNFNFLFRKHLYFSVVFLHVPRVFLLVFIYFTTRKYHGPSINIVSSSTLSYTPVCWGGWLGHGVQPTTLSNFGAAGFVRFAKCLPKLGLHDKAKHGRKGAQTTPFPPFSRPIRLLQFFLPLFPMNFLPSSFTTSRREFLSRESRQFPFPIIYVKPSFLDSFPLSYLNNSTQFHFFLKCVFKWVFIGLKCSFLQFLSQNNHFLQ